MTIKIDFSLYNSEKAEEYRKEIRSIAADLEELEYKRFCLNKKIKATQEEYAKFLGLVEPEKKGPEITDQLDYEQYKELNDE